LDISLPEGTSVEACVKNMNTNSEYRCSLAQVEFGDLDFYMRFPR
jgi:hypothetical protein